MRTSGALWDEIITALVIGRCHEEIPGDEIMTFLINWEIVNQSDLVVYELRRGTPTFCITGRILASAASRLHQRTKGSDSNVWPCETRQQTLGYSLVAHHGDSTSVAEIAQLFDIAEV